MTTDWPQISVIWVCYRWVAYKTVVWVTRVLIKEKSQLGFGSPVRCHYHTSSLILNTWNNKVWALTLNRQRRFSIALPSTLWACWGSRSEATGKRRGAKRDGAASPAATSRPQCGGLHWPETPADRRPVSPGTPTNGEEEICTLLTVLTQILQSVACWQETGTTSQ